MSDLEQLLREGRDYQYEEDILPPIRRPPSMKPWVILAGILILISLGIEIFWPLPGSYGPLPACHSLQEGAAPTSCERPGVSDDTSKKENTILPNAHH